VGGAVGGLLLTGGASRRMGSDKALLKVDGRRLVDRAAAVLGAVAAPVIEVGPGWAPGLRHALGGRMRMELEDGMMMAVEADGVDGILSLHRNVACLDTICRVRTDSGRVGFCDFETTHNSRNGADLVPTMVGAVVSDSYSRTSARAR
jgi:hypothetical protein